MTRYQSETVKLRWTVVVHDEADFTQTFSLDPVLPDVRWHSRELLDQIAKEHNAFEPMMEALAGVWGLLERGDLVRNISHDSEPGWAMKQVRFVKQLKAIETVLKLARGEKP